MTQRLLATANDEKVWAVLDGYALGHGLDLESLRLDRFCNFVWWFMTRNAESEQEVEKLRATLWQPPAGEAAAGPWAPEAESASFSAFKDSLSA